MEDVIILTMDEGLGIKMKVLKDATKTYCPGTLTVKSGKDIVNYKEGSNKPERYSCHMV